MRDKKSLSRGVALGASLALLAVSTVHYASTRRDTLDRATEFEASAADALEPVADSDRNALSLVRATVDGLSDAFSDGTASCDTGISGVRGPLSRRVIVEIRERRGRVLCSSPRHGTASTAGWPKVSRPWVSGGGDSGIVEARIDPRFLEDAVAARPLPADVEVLAADRGGAILASLPGGFTGRAGGRLLHLVGSAEDRVQTAHVRWPDGRIRATAVQFLGGMAIASGIDDMVAMRSLDLRETLAASMLAFCLALAGVAAWRCRGIVAAPPRRARVAGEPDAGELILHRSFMEHSTDLVYAKDLSGRYIAANRAFLDLHALDPAEIGVIRESDLARDELVGTVAKAASERSKVLAAHERSVFDLSVWHKGMQQQRVYQTSYNPLRDANGTVIGVSCIGRDVTEKRRATERIERAEREIREAGEAKSRFLAAASHDLRQPAQAAMLFADTLARQAMGTASAPILANLRKSLDSLNGLLEVLLRLSQLDTGAVVPLVEDFPLWSVFDEIEANLGHLARAKGLALVFVPCRVDIRSDRVLVMRVLTNLVENAIKYTDRGRVLVDCHSRGDFVRVEVRDSGIGIREEDIETIWDEFSQLNNPERDRSRGLGLGLFIVRRIASLLGHEVRVSSEPGRGSTFSIDLPCGERPQLPAPPALPAPVVPAPPRLPAFVADPAPGQRLVVVIDDEAQVREGLQCILEIEGYDVVAAENLDEAIAGITELRRIPDFIVADYRLREDRVGTDAIRAIRSHTGRTVPALVLTGEIAPAVQADAGSIGVSVVHKPVEAERLVALIEDLATA